MVERPTKVGAYIDIPGPIVALTPRRLAAAERLARYRIRVFARRHGYTAFDYSAPTVHQSWNWAPAAVAVCVDAIVS